VGACKTDLKDKGHVVPVPPTYTVHLCNFFIKPNRHCCHGSYGAMPTTTWILSNL